VKPRDPRIAANPPRLLWLQPGPQKIGDQSFDPFAYFEDTASNPLRAWTSSRKDLDDKFETYTFFAVLAVLVGYLMQFIGLRGMKAWVSLAQLGIMLIMSVLRGCLRMQRLGRNDNMLLTAPDMVAGYELDWLSLEIIGGDKRAEGRGKGKGEKKGRNWREKGAQGEEEKGRCCRGTLPASSGRPYTLRRRQAVDEAARSPVNRHPGQRRSRSGLTLTRR
jgi:hypothetical protein